MVDTLSKSAAGVASLVVGTAFLLPGVSPTAELPAQLALLGSAVLMSAGAYLVGTDVDGRPV